MRIFCKRETRYDVLPESLTGPGRKFELAVTEFQDLHISTFTSDETLLTAEAFERYVQYKFSSESCCLSNNIMVFRREMITAQRLWYTFAIVPVEMDNTLQAQAALEVGEFGDFTTDTMLGPTRNDSELLKALIKIVDVVIDRIDDVGYRNRGPWIE